MSKLRTWYVAELTHDTKELCEGSLIAILVTLRLGTVEAPNRAEATRLAREQWPGKKLEIIRGSQG